MTLQDRTAHIERLFADCHGILAKKGADYSGKADALSNFKRNAERLGLTKYQVWSVYTAKHFDSIMNAIKASPEYPQVESEPIEERIKDLINYGAILACMIIEDNQTK